MLVSAVDKELVSDGSSGMGLGERKPRDGVDALEDVDEGKGGKILS